MQMKVKAVAKDIGYSPRKVRMVADMVRGQKVSRALEKLRFMPTPAAIAVAKTVRSAVANAENNFQMLPAELKITEIMVDQGRTLKRHRPQARGRIDPILRRSAHITVFVAEEEK
jgi:large subunit ribosomal protein L22